MKKLILVMASILLVLGSAGTSMAYPMLGTSEYQVVSTSAITWDAAKAAAEALAGGGWHLVTITSQEEQNFVADQLLVGSLDQPNLYWAGASQVALAGAYPELTDPWNWVTGETWGFTAWANDQYPEPNDWGGVDERYLALDGRSFLSPDSSGVLTPRNWTWTDNQLSESIIIGYVAERTAPVPEPATMLLLGSGLLGLAGLRRKFKK